MVDIHSHFLPQIDDGPRHVNESVAMLADSYLQGVTVCVSTSHIILHGEEDIETFLKKREMSVKLLEDSLAKSDVVVPKLLYGAEVFLDNDISKFNEFKKICISGTNLLLVELSTRKYNPNYAEWLYLLNLKGSVPILAHIERYPYVKELLADLEAINVVYQMNARAVLRNKWFKYLLDLYYDGKAVVISSDMHNMGMRSSCMKKAYDKVCNYYSQDVADDIFERNAEKILGLEFNK